jgi:epoxyqueuosine reductase
LSGDRGRSTSSTRRKATPVAVQAVRADLPSAPEMGGSWPGFEESELRRAVKSVAAEHGLEVVGFARARRYERARQSLEHRLREGLFARMRFTAADPAKSCDPTAHLDGAETVIACGLPYDPTDLHPKPPHAAKIAAVARQDNYSLLRKGLEAIADLLRTRGFEAKVFCDSPLLMDRPPAVDAGIGGFGKNCMVITEKFGSFVVLGSVVTDAALRPESASSGLAPCGTCFRCRAACPSGAILAPGVLDARRCLAYLLQAPEWIPRWARPLIGNRFYGCDDCQTCCPLNRKARLVAAEEGGPVTEESSGTAWVDPVWVLGVSDEVLLRKFGHFYIPRRNPDYLRRNALVVLGNTNDAALAEVAEGWLTHPRAMLRGHAVWAYARLAGSSATDPLHRLERAEKDQRVVAEIEACLSELSEARVADL